MGILTALKAFWVSLGSSETAKQIEHILKESREEKRLLQEETTASNSESLSKPAEKKASTSKRPRSTTSDAPSEAILLLAALQREARFIDFIQESLAGYSAEAIGSACQNVHDKTAEVLERFFEIRPLSDKNEGETVSLESLDSARCLLSGKVPNGPPYTGQLVHAGWEAKKCELPQWSGKAEDAQILAPFEIDLS